MRITYYALKPIQVGDAVREPGDLVPEAAEWPFLHGYIRQGSVAAVLVATLPEEQQIALLEWEADQEGADVVHPADVAEPVSETTDPGLAAEAKDATPATTRPTAQTQTKQKVRG